MTTRRERRQRRLRQGRQLQPRLKRQETPRRGSWIAPRSIGYWIRRPEPSIAVSILFALLFLLIAFTTRDWVPVVAALLVLAAGAFAWWNRATVGWMAEQWRQRR